MSCRPDIAGPLTWKATGYTSFTDFGANDQGQQGGVLSMTVTHYCKTMGMTMTGIPMTVTSAVNAPAGYTEGATVGDFTQPTSGTIVIQPEQWPFGGCCGTGHEHIRARTGGASRGQAS